MDIISISLEPLPLSESNCLENEDNASTLSTTNLAKLIPRIALERGSFINITEQSLLEEIASLEGKSNGHRDSIQSLKDGDEAAALDYEDGDANAEREIKPQSVLQSEEEFIKSRAELCRLIGLARNEAAISLDFVSLLISIARPAAGTTSMSPHLKTHVPVGSLGADRIKGSHQPDDIALCVGWKYEALTSAASRLSDACDRLKTQVVNDRKYWSQVHEIAAGGEALSIVRTSDFRGLAVRYGFGSNDVNVKDQGIATLRRRPDGSVFLKTESEKRNSVLRVSIITQSGQKGEYLTKIHKAVRGDVKSEIKRARDLLFDESLFFEIIKETRLLVSRGVQLDFGNKVTIQLPTVQICIDMSDIPLEGNAKDCSQQVKSSDQGESYSSLNDPNFLAETISSILHLLFSKLHADNLARRRSVPPPLDSNFLSNNSQKRVNQAILTPLLESLDQGNLMTSLVSLLEDLINKLI
ncbi:mediator complex, subunit Med17 [Dipodascopsis uninucleata]